jgi:hypothetical protein
MGLQGDQGAQGDQGSQGEQGPQGDPGPAGLPGAASFPFGDGSAQARSFEADATLADANLQYTDFTVKSGVTLTIPSGAIIRCTGTFVNDGTIVVQSFAPGGFGSGPDDGNTLTAFAAPGAGISARSPGQGEFGDNTDFRSGGIGGVGVSEFVARWILHPGPSGGGGGAATEDSGSAGGGTLVVIASEAVINNGRISADGVNALNAGSGGGGGGIIVLASETQVINAGELTADGGNGENADANEAPSGGGGGGIIHLIAPSLTTSAGSMSVLGGQAGNGAGQATTITPRRAGAGGGAGGGNGGAGGEIETNNVVTAAENGAVGHALATKVDPSLLF